MLNYLRYKQTISSYTGDIKSFVSRIANIIYNMDLFGVNASGERTVNNAGSDGVQSSGDMYGSNFIELGAGQSVPLDIPYTLGSEQVLTGLTTSNFSGVTSTLTVVGDWLEIDVATLDNLNLYTYLTTATSPRITATADNNNQHLFTFTAYKDNTLEATARTQRANDTSTGTLYSQALTDTATEYTVELDYYSTNPYFNIEGVSGTGKIYLKVSNLAISIKQITNPNSFLTTFDYTNKQHQTVDNSLNTPSTTYSQTNDFNMGFSHTSNLTQADNDTLNANPNLIYNVWFDSYVLPSGFAKADMVNFYPAGEGAVAVEKIYDISDVSLLTFASIINYTASCKTDLANQNIGATNHLVKQDATTGAAISLADAGTIEHNGDGRTIVVKTRTSTRTVTIELTPDVVELKTLVSTTTAGTITMNAIGTVTASSGIVTVDTTTLQVGVKSLITVTGLAIDGVSTLFDGLDGRVHTYTEDVE